MAYPWVKLYTEMIHDPKIGRLSEHLQLVFVKLLCVTGEHDAERSGALPPLDEIAWSLRMDDDELSGDMADLAKVGIVREVEGVWYVTNFSARQSAMTTGERVSAFRERQQKAEYHDLADATPGPQPCNEGVTSRYTDKTRLDVDKTRLDVDVDAEPAAAKADHHDDLADYFFQKVQDASGLVSSQAQKDAYLDILADVRALPTVQQRPFLESLFAEAANSTRGRPSLNWYRKVVDAALAEGRLPGEKLAAPETPPPRVELVTETWRNPYTGELETHKVGKAVASGN